MHVQELMPGRCAMVLLQHPPKHLQHGVGLPGTSHIVYLACCVHSWCWFLSVPSLPLSSWLPHLKEVVNLAVRILRWLADGVPHLAHVIAKDLSKLVEGSLCLVAYDKQQHCALAVGLRSEQFQVDLFMQRSRRNWGTML